MTGDGATAARGRTLPARGLRPRLILTFTLVASAASLAVAVPSYLLVRRGAVERATDAAVVQGRVNLRLAADALAPPVTLAQTEEFTAALHRRGSADAVIALHPGGTVSTSVSLTPAAVPAGLRSLVERGRIGYARTRVGGVPYVVVGGGLVPDGPRYYFFSRLSRVEADLAAMRRALLLTSAAVVLLSGAFGAVAASGLLRPIGRARAAARQLEAGLLDTRLPEAGRDEFADLARSFNQMAAALERTVSELRALEASHRQFVSDVSHELRTPLTGLLTASELLEANAEVLPERVQRPAALVTLESRRLVRLVEDLLEISRIDAGVGTMTWQSVDVGDAVRRSLRARGWEDRIEVSCTGDVTTFADPRRLDAILGNLIGNALEHGGPPVRVTVGADGDDVCITVSDEGPGVAPEHLPRIFDRFYKADPSRPRSAGSGLGLGIARENARLHGGDVTAESDPGRGAVFRVRLPRRPVAPGDEGRSAVDAEATAGGWSGR